jgi:7-keto-8-aminopelargonate synthetase-like enzyme
MAALIQTEDVVVCQSGYCANVGLIQSIVDESTPVILIYLPTPHCGKEHVVPE